MVSKNAACGVNLSVMLLALVMAGCQGSHKPTTFPVSGIVSFRDGKPVKGFTVSFRTADQVPAFTASGKTDELGKFHLNAAQGDNTVIIVRPPPPPTPTTWLPQSANG